MIKKSIKIIQTSLSVLTLLFALLLWVTASEWLPSMSAFHRPDLDNVVYYGLMHISISAFFFILFTLKKRWVDFFTAWCPLLILAFDTYGYPMIHNISTVLLFISASFSIIYYCSTRERPYRILLVGISTLFFGLGLFTSLHLFLAEAVVMFNISVGNLRELWIKNT